MSTQNVRQQPFSSRQKAKTPKQILNKTWWWWQAMAPHSIPLPCALAFSPPSHRDATTPSPCWAPHFMTQERNMFSNPTPSKRRWAMPRHWLSLRPCTAPLFCSLQHLLKLSLLNLRPSLFNLSQSFHLCWITEIWSLNLCVCFTFSSSAFTFLIEMNSSFMSLFAIWLLQPVPWKMRHGMVIGMQNEILIGIKKPPF